MAPFTKTITVIAGADIFKQRIRETLQSHHEWNHTTDTTCISLMMIPELQDPSISYIIANCKCVDDESVINNLIRNTLPRMAQGFGTNSIACTDPGANRLLAELAQHYEHTHHGITGEFNGAYFFPKCPARWVVVQTTSEQLVTVESLTVESHG